MIVMNEQISVEELVQDVTGYNIAIHGIYSGSLEEKTNLAKQIMKTGIKLSDNWKSILGTTVSIGNSSNSNLQGDIKNYQYGYGEKCNLIIRVPDFLVESNGEKIYLGFPENNIKTAAQQYSTTCVFDQICSELKNIPSEFIYGYYNDSENITLNPDYYDNLSQEKKDSLFSKVRHSMSDFSKTISNHVINNDVEKLESLKCSFEKLGINEPVVENALKFLQDKKYEVAKNEEKNDEDIVTKLSSFLSALPMKHYKLFSKTLDEKALLENKNILENFCNGLSFEDIQKIENSNVGLVLKVSNLIEKFPKQLMLDRIIEDDMINYMNNGSTGKRIILTEYDLDKKKTTMENFDKCVATYLMAGGKDIFDRFYKLINNMSKQGVHVNVGNSIIKLGNAFASKMEKLQNDSERNSQAWKFCLPHILHAYDVSKSIGNERYNSEEHKMFEKRLEALGIIELEKESKSAKKQYGKNTIVTDNTPDKVTTKQPIVTEEEKIYLAKCQYINTGMLPLGYRLDNSGAIMKENQIDELRKKAYDEYKRQKEMDKQKEKSRIRIGIRGEMLPVKTKQPQQQKTKVSVERQRLER